VLWIDSALNDLAASWNGAQDRQLVSDAADTIDAILRVRPYSDSESREGNLRIMLVPPLAVLYDVYDDDRWVTVRAVWQP
jgi:hypothetical protein